MDAVAASDHGGGPMLEGEASRDLRQARQLSLNHQGRIAQDHCAGGVKHVRAGEPEVQPAPLRSEPLGDRPQEGEDVVLRLAFDLTRTGRINGCVARRHTDPLPIRVGYDTRAIQRLGGQQLDLQPELELAPLAELLLQLRQRIALDHGRKAT